MQKTLGEKSRRIGAVELDVFGPAIHSGAGHSIADAGRHAAYNFPS
jgi:hypothetical protein